MAKQNTTRLLRQALDDRILIIDGAMGTMIQKFNLDESGYRGERFKDYPTDLKGNNDLLCLTQPDIIKNIHSLYAEAGAEIITTNSFNATRIAQADYGLQSIANELNIAAASLAREVADEFTQKNPGSLLAYWGLHQEQLQFLQMSMILVPGTSILMTWLLITTNRQKPWLAGRLILS